MEGFLRRPATYGSILTLAGSILTVLAFSTPHWIESSRKTNKVFKRLGLWELCLHNFQTFGNQGTFGNVVSYGTFGNPYYSQYFCFWIFDPHYTFVLSFLEQPFFIAVQILYTAGFFMACIAFLLLLVKSCLQGMGGEIVISMIMGVVMVVSCLCCTSAIIIFAICAPYWGWVADPGLGLGVPFFPQVRFHGHSNPSASYPGAQTFYAAMPQGNGKTVVPISNHLSWSFILAIVACTVEFVSAILFFLDAQLLKSRKLEEEIQLRVRRLSGEDMHLKQ